MASQKVIFYRACIINPLNDTKCEYFPDGLLVIKNGKIKDVLEFKSGQRKYRDLMIPANTIDLKRSVILPALYDMHFHWVQDDVREMPKDSLLEWLEKYTFPAEMKFSRKKYSADSAKKFFKNIFSHGTIGGACYSSIHMEALDFAMKESIGDFIIGNVLMNMNSPGELTQSESESIQTVKKGIKKYGEKYCLTPRFAISTSPMVMKEAARLADKAGCFKQTHLSETPQEIKFVLSLYRSLPGFKKVKSYTEIYKKTGMLGKRSLMGHGIHLSPEELKLLSKTRTKIIHCPTSNAPIKEKGLGSGLFDFHKVEKAGVDWAMGSDIGGGPFLSMLDVMRSFVDQNKRAGVKGATYIKALYRSSLAGAEILGFKKNSGNLVKGKRANFIVLSLKKAPGPTAEATLRDLIAPLRLTRDRYQRLVLKTVYKGKVIFDRN